MESKDTLQRNQYSEAPTLQHNMRKRESHATDVRVVVIVSLSGRSVPLAFNPPSPMAAWIYWSQFLSLADIEEVYV